MARKIEIGHWIVLKPTDENYFVLFANYVRYTKARECIHLICDEATVDFLIEARNTLFTSVRYFYPELERYRLAITTKIPMTKKDKPQDLTITVLGKK